MIKVFNTTLLILFCFISGRCLPMDEEEYNDSDREFMLAAYKEKLEKLVEDTEDMRSLGPPRKHMIEAYREKIESLEGDADMANTAASQEEKYSAMLLTEENVEKQENLQDEISDLKKEIKRLKNNQEIHKKTDFTAVPTGQYSSTTMRHTTAFVRDPKGRPGSEDIKKEEAGSDISGDHYQHNVSGDELQPMENMDHREIQRLYKQQAIQQAEGKEDHTNIMMLNKIKEKQETEKRQHHEDIRILQKNQEIHKSKGLGLTRSSPIREHNIGLNGNIRQDENPEKERELERKQEAKLSTLYRDIINTVLQSPDEQPLEQPPVQGSDIDVKISKVLNITENNEDSDNPVLREPVLKQRQKVEREREPIIKQRQKIEYNNGSVSPKESDEIVKFRGNMEDSHEADNTSADVYQSETKKKHGINPTNAVVLTVAAIAVVCALIFIVFTFLQWRKTLKIIKVDQIRSRRSLKVIRDEVERLVSSSHSVLLEDQASLDDYGSEEYNDEAEEDHLLGDNTSQSNMSYTSLTKLPPSMVISPLSSKATKSQPRPPRTKASTKSRGKQPKYSAFPPRHGSPEEFRRKEPIQTGSHQEDENIIQHMAPIEKQ